MASSYRSVKTGRILISSVFILALLIPGAAAAVLRDPLAPQTCPPPAAPSSFWGYVTLNAAPAPIGLKVAAWIGGVEVASTATQAMNGATYYLLDVPDRAVDPVTGEVCRQGGAAGETVTFVLCDYVTANETGAWNGGSLVQRDLTAGGSCQASTVTPTSTKTSTPTHTPTLTNTPTPTWTPTATATAGHRSYLPLVLRDTPGSTPTPTRTPTATATADHRCYLPLVLRNAVSSR